MVKLIWILIALNTLALLIFIGSYFYYNSGKQVSYEERGWTMVMAFIGIVFILLAAVPLRFSQSAGTLIFSGFFALLPLLVLLFIKFVK